MTPEEIDHLRKIPAGFVDLSLFHELARLTVTSVIEMVPMRRNQSGHTEVLLMLRGDDDTFWPGLYHNPGTVLRPTDTDTALASAKERLLLNELGGAKPASPWFFTGPRLLVSQRGTSLCLVTWLEIIDSTVGEFFPATELPTNIVTEQLEPIRASVKAFEAPRSSATKLEDILIL